MAKIITIPSSIEEIKKTKNKVDGFIIGIKDMAVNVNYCIDIGELQSIIDVIGNKELFIAVNKNIHNNELDNLKKIMISLNDYNIKGVMYYDVSVLSIYNSLDLNYDLVYSAEHYTTNYNSINYWYDFNVKYVVVSNDISEDEMITISKNSKLKCMINLFGYLPMFVSRRHIVNNYLDYFKIDDSSSINYIEKEGKVYPIIDNNIGTSVYSSNIFNGIRLSLKLDVEYIILNSFNINLQDFMSIIDMFNSVTQDNVSEYDKKINSMFSNVDYAFLDNKTIYRVKKNEK